MNIQNIRKKNRKNSFDIVADDPSEKVDDDFILACRIAAEEQRKA